MNACLIHLGESELASRVSTLPFTGCRILTSHRWCFGESLLATRNCEQLRRPKKKVFFSEIKRASKRGNKNELLKKESCSFFGQAFVFPLLEPVQHGG
jgi:hypothetical protein